MELWTSQSSPSKQTAASIGCALLGVVLMFGLRNFSTAGINAMAGFFLGVFLLLIGGIELLIQGKQSVVIDPGMRQITVVDRNTFGSKNRSIAFHEVKNVHIGFLGKKSNGVSIYYLVLHLENGEEYPLFAPGRFYQGSSDRAIVSGWKTRLEGYITA